MESLLTLSSAAEHEFMTLVSSLCFGVVGVRPSDVEPDRMAYSQRGQVTSLFGLEA